MGHKTGHRELSHSSEVGGTCHLPCLKGGREAGLLGAPDEGGAGSCVNKEPTAPYRASSVGVSLSASNPARSLGIKERGHGSGIS